MAYSVLFAPWLCLLVNGELGFKYISLGEKKYTVKEWTFIFTDMLFWKVQLRQPFSFSV